MNTDESRRKKPKLEDGIQTDQPLVLVQPQVGDRVYARFSNGEWYWGVATKKFWKNDFLYYSIQYDDGDFVAEHKAADGIATEEQSQLNDNGDDSKDDGILYDDDEFVPEHNAADGIATEEQANWSDSNDPQVEPIPIPTLSAPIASRSNSAVVVTPERVNNTTQDAPSSSVPSESTNGPKPNPAPSSKEAVRKEVMDSKRFDSLTKKEGSASSLSDEERKKRKACLERWIDANTDPRTGKGRYVFRRGCAKACITTILAGMGTDEFAIAQNPPDILPGEPNPFISAGEFYVAGRECFNFFGPRFPGDAGMVNVEAFQRNPTQKEFHMFVQCSTVPYKRHWHGKDASTGRMYVGVYRKVVDEVGDSEVSTTVKLDDHDLDHLDRMGMAQYKLEKQEKRYKKEGLGEYKDTLGFRNGIKEAKKEVGLEEWNRMTQRKKEILAMKHVLLGEDFAMETVPIEFVRYDENLYQTLVDADAIIDRKGQTGRVALTPEALHQWY